MGTTAAPAGLRKQQKAMSIEEWQLRDIVSGSATRLDLWNRMLKAANVRVMAEVGVWKGEFAKHILEQCEFIDRYYMIDPWAHLPDWKAVLLAVTTSPTPRGNTMFASSRLLCASPAS